MKILKKIIEILLYPLILILLVIALVCLLIKLPFDYVKYKSSLYYRTYRKKYKPFFADSSEFELHNVILKHQLPIRYITNPDEDSDVEGWFMMGDVLLISNSVDFEYDSESGTWKYCVYDEYEDKSTTLTIDEYVHGEIAEVNRLVGEDICRDAVVLIDSDILDAADDYLEPMKAEKHVLLYKGNLDEVLVKLCDSESAGKDG